MQLPFTHGQFLDVFGAYNVTLWPLVVLLWLATAAALALVVQGRPVSRTIAMLLALHWFVSGAVYHLLYFRPINPVATLFGTAFLVQSLLFLWFGAVRPRLVFTAGRAPGQRLGLFLALYGLAYPGLVLLTGLAWPRLPLFAVPCPTTLVTAGFLLMVEPRRLRRLMVIPILWCLVGGSAALTLGVRPDLALFLAAVVMLAYVAAPRLLTHAHAA